MTGFALRAVPWSLVAACGAVVSVLMALVAAEPGTLWPLQGAAIGLLAGGAAWSMDETAAALVDTLPRPLWWRTAARAAAALPLALVWAGCVLVARDRLPAHTELFLLQGGAALLLGIGFVTWRRAHGVAAPGTRFASGVIPAALALALVRPFPERLPLFPVWESAAAWTLSLAIWGALALAAGGLLAVALAETARSHFRAAFR